MTARRSRLAALVTAALLMGGCGSTAKIPPPAAASPPLGSTVVHAAGLDPVAPLYQELESVLAPQKITLDYQLSSAPKLIGGTTGAAVSMAAAASSTRIAGALRAQGKNYVPVGFGGVGVIYNLPIKGLRLGPKALAMALSGKIGHWNAKVIAQDNPTLKLPDTPITIVHLSTPSLLTELLTQYLSAGDPQWRKAQGSGLAINWPAGTAVADETAAETIVDQTPGAIGYVSQGTALLDHLTTAEMRNPAGQFVAPTLHAMTVVGRQGSHRGPLSVQTIDAPGAGAYPITDEQYVMTFADPCAAGISGAQGRGVGALLSYLTESAGQALVQRFLFAPLPPGLRARAQATVQRLSCGGRPL